MQPDEIIEVDESLAPETVSVHSFSDLKREVADVRRLLHFHRHTTADRTQPLEFSNISTITFTSVASFTPDPRR